MRNNKNVKATNKLLYALFGYHINDIDSVLQANAVIKVIQYLHHLTDDDPIIQTVKLRRNELERRERNEIQ